MFIKGAGSVNEPSPRASGERGEVRCEEEPLLSAGSQRLTETRLAGDDLVPGRASE